MKTIITAKENTLSSLFDLRFGRGTWFCIYDSETKTAHFIKNKFATEERDAGIKTAETMVDLGIQKVISGDFGLKARDILAQNNIQMVILEDDDKTIADIIRLVS